MTSSSSRPVGPAPTSTNTDIPSLLELARQHIGWLKMYVQGMTPENWRDMRDRAEIQLNELSDTLSRLSGNGGGAAPTALEEETAILPREPTSAMLDAALAADPYWSINAIPRVKNAYRAMVAAAPKAPAASEQLSPTPIDDGAVERET